jgi:hypothetical protein
MISIAAVDFRSVCMWQHCQLTSLYPFLSCWRASPPTCVNPHFTFHMLTELCWLHTPFVLTHTLTTSCRGAVEVFSSLRTFRDDLAAYAPDHFVCVPLVLDTLHNKVRGESHNYRLTCAG